MNGRVAKRLRRESKDKVKDTKLNFHVGSPRRVSRRRLIDRSFTRSSGVKAEHIVMDHREEIEHVHPSWTNHDRMIVRKAQREARRLNANTNSLG